eukprot:1965622-Ditylum_brightwellii.AAC.1
MRLLHHQKGLDIAELVQRNLLSCLLSQFYHDRLEGLSFMLSFKGLDSGTKRIGGVCCGFPCSASVSLNHPGNTQ